MDPERKVNNLLLMLDLSDCSPMELVKELQQFHSGGTGKAGAQYNALKRHLSKALATALPPGACTFSMQCIECLLHIDSVHTVAIGHLLLAAYVDVHADYKDPADVQNARHLAASLLLRAVDGAVALDARLVVKLVAAFELDMAVLEEVSGQKQTEPGHRTSLAVQEQSLSTGEEEG
eukprot:jgi/Mesen1/5111/ME000254S04133